MSTDGEARQIHRRIAKACEPCRRRKAKCDGKFPTCTLCLSRGETASCQYRERPRNRVSRKLAKVGVAEQQNDGFDSGRSSEDRPPVNLTDEPPSFTLDSVARNSNDVAQEPDGAQTDRAPLGVNAAQSHSHLYYGPSSNFAFLQHIHQTFTRPDAAYQGQTASLDRFKYRDRFFAPGLQRSGTEKGHCLFLPEQLARQFLDLFMDSLWHLTPFLNKPQLLSMLDRLYTADPGERLGSGDTATILLSLANGATLTKHSAWVDTLMERALVAVPVLEMVITMRSVQISLLIVHVQISCGRHNMAYIQLGSAARKAFATGLHRDADYQTSQSQTPEQIETRRLTFWSLVFLERWLSFWLGRPSTMEESLINTPMPTTSPLVKALASLSNIIQQASRHMYDDCRAPSAKLWQSAQHIRLELQNFQRQMEPVLGFKLDGGWEAAMIKPEQLFITNFFYHTWTITFRPFLIMATTRTQRNQEAGGRAGVHPSSDLGGVTTLPVDMWWLPEACQIAVDSARHFISFFALAVTQNSIIRGLSFTTAYVESATSLLFYDSLRSHEAIDTNSASLKKALDGLKLMIPTALVPGVIATLEQILSELAQVRDADGDTPMVPSKPSDLSTTTQSMQPSLTGTTTLPPTHNQSLDDPIPFTADSFDINWSYALPFDLGFEQGLFAPNLGDYFDAEPFVTA